MPLGDLFPYPCVSGVIRAIGSYCSLFGTKKKFRPIAPSGYNFVQIRDTVRSKRGEMLSIEIAHALIL